MMTRSPEKQCRLLAVTMEELIPENHFLRKLDAAISFDFVYDIVAPLYSAQGRPSIDPVILVKMLLLGYLYGIDSERKLAEEVRYNIAYRWYLGFDLDDVTPDHSTFSQNRRRRFKGHEVFRQIFDQIVARCQEAGLVKGECVVMDSTHIKANADTRNNITIEVTRRPEAYWDELNQTVLPEETIKKVRNPSDPEAGYMNRTGKPKGFHYLNHQCSDADTGIILDVSVTGGDVQDCECCVERYAYLKNEKHYPIRSAGLDSGYDTNRIHYGLTRLGITAYIRPCMRGTRQTPKRFTQNDFIWDAQNNKFICPNGKDIILQWMTKPQKSMFPPIMKKVDKRGIPTVSIILLAIFTIITCQFDFTTLVMATTPIQLYMYLAMIFCVVRLRKYYPVEARKKMGLAVMPGGAAGLALLSTCVFLICMFAIYVNGTDYFITGFLVLLLGLIGYVLCKWAYKGRVLDNAEAYPLNPKTKLGLGDLIDIGVYIFFSGAMALGGAIFLVFYESSYGEEYYLEEYGTGFFSDFYGMIDACKWLGIVLLVLGAVIWFIGKKTEGDKAQQLQTIRKEELDNTIREIHGEVPGEMTKAS